LSLCSEIQPESDPNDYTYGGYYSQFRDTEPEDVRLLSRLPDESSNDIQQDPSWTSADQQAEFVQPSAPEQFDQQGESLSAVGPCW
jgi:hypothetical protein